MSVAVRRLLIAAAVGAAVCIVAAGCRPQPASSPAPSASPVTSQSASATPTVPAPSPTPSPIETEKPQDESLPSGCEDIYSPAMLASLNDQIPPLNDPGVTMLSTQIVSLLELLDSGTPTIRCSWGSPSEVGIATNVTLLERGQRDAILADLRAAGFGCADFAGGTLCSIEDRGVSLDDQPYSSGEDHYVDDAHWVSTAWLNIHPDGYTADIVDTLWG